MIDESYIQKRIDVLVSQSGIAARQISLELGHSPSYINNITRGRSLPSFPEFLYLCQILKISPKEFFDSTDECNLEQMELISLISEFSTNDVHLLLDIAKRLKN